MNPQTLIVIGVACATLLVLVLDQLRRDRLYVGYAVAVIVAMVAVVLTASIPVLFPAMARVIGPLLPEAALMVLTLILSLFVLVYVLTQVTLVANRVAAVVQEMALRSAADDAVPRGRGANGEGGVQPTGAADERPGAPEAERERP